VKLYEGDDKEELRYVQTVIVDQLAGKTIGDYQVERLLGRGKMSSVYMAQQRYQKRIVMITTFNIPESLSAPARERFTARFTHVGSALVKLNHPNILPIYDCGVQYGSPYLVTSFVKGGSLARVLKQQPRFAPEQALEMLKQIAAGLDYAHSQGIVHGILNPANVLLSSEQVLQVTGFGLKQVLQMQGIEAFNHPQAHLFSIAGTFLGSPEYIAPECVVGAPVDARADIYSLGIMLFELLSGALPFAGTDPLEIATRRLKHPIPSLHETCTDLPAAFDLILYLALEREPEKRYKSAGELARAFERVQKVLESAAKESATFPKQATMHSEITLPPTVNWFDEEIAPTRKWQLMPPVVTGKGAAVQGYQQETIDLSSTNGMTQAPEQEQVGRFVTVSESISVDAHNQPTDATDPFAWWSATSANTVGKTPGTFARSAAKRPTNYKANTQRKASVKGRRQVVVGLLAGTAVIGIAGIGGISFARFIESTRQSQAGNAQSTLSNTSPAQATQGTTQAATHGTQQTPTGSATHKPQTSPTKGTQPKPGTTPTSGSTSTPGSTPTPKPTQPPPTPTPTPPGHTGTVVGYTNQPTNSGKNFTNPTDGNSSMLVHLSNGNFVACERQCTHQGVNVNYDTGSQKLVCPAHGAVFDPANGFSQVQGSGPSGLSPLSKVSIRVNGDGTITTG
jgi:serine/threonine protein kinase/nitrite reductase/ring-hydroxylating ferredoxin subunit